MEPLFKKPILPLLFVRWCRSCKQECTQRVSIEKDGWPAQTRIRHTVCQSCKNVNVYVDQKNSK